MEPARLASKQQAASKRLAPQGPRRAPEQQDPKTEKKWYHAIRVGFAQFFYILRLGGQEIAIRGDFRPFWPRAALGTPWRGPKREKTQFPGARGTFGGGIRPPQKFLPEIAQLFDVFRFGRPDRQGQEIAKSWFFGLFWPRTALGT